VSKNATIKVAASLVAICVLAGSAYLALNHSNPNPDYAPGHPGVEVIIDVPTGATGSEIAKILFSKGVVKSSGAFFARAVADPRSAKIAPGSHRMNTRISSKEALDQLLDTKRIANLIRITEGAWTDEIIAQMVTVGFSKSELLTAISRITRPSGFTGNEGILFPAQYSFGSSSSAQAALQAMVDRFGVEANGSGIDQGGDGFTPEQMLTIASLVQAEGDPSDFGKISQVIRNRLKVGMPLQLDTTIHYITRTRGKVFLSTNATRIASPYNTYLHYGLPPGPIDNPGRAAMDAAVHPTPGNWIFFITVKPGDTRFTDSNAQFLKWKSEYEKNLAAGAFGKTS